MILDIYCNQCQYYLKNNVVLIVESEDFEIVEITVIVKHITEVISEFKFTIDNEYAEFSLGEFEVGGYEVSVNDKYTAFDVLNKTSESPRYGFLSDFINGDFEENIKQMNKYHLNLIQFYDWFYRHHDLVPCESEFIDPMGRTINKSIIDNKISKVHNFGMKAIAYGAVYGAEKEYYLNNQDELLFNNGNDPFIFINIIGIMDISSNTRWRQHIINEFKKTIVQMDFDGIHLDQYGFPKYSVSEKNGIVNLSKEIPTFINETLDQTMNLKDEVIIDFNYVNNWPIETIAYSSQEFSYIEVWPPHDTYYDLSNIIKEAKLFSNNRPVVLAAYIHAFQEDSTMIGKEMSALFTMACVYSQGAYPLLFGEKNGILSDPYYVNYSIYNDDFGKRIRTYQDFIVKYKELLFTDLVDLSHTFINGINNEVVIEDYKTSSDFKEGSIGIRLYEKDEFKVLHLVNLIDQMDNNWNVPKQECLSIESIMCKYLLYEDIEGIYFASPDKSNGSMSKLDYEYVDHEQGKAIKFLIPSLDVWSMVYIKIKK